MIADRAVLVTGANRGIGRALVEEALRRGAKRVYSGTRQPFTHLDGRVTPLTLDVTLRRLRELSRESESLDILINNAGLALYDDLSDRAAPRPCHVVPLTLSGGLDCAGGVRRSSISRRPAITEKPRIMKPSTKAST